MCENVFVYIASKPFCSVPTWSPPVLTSSYLFQKCLSVFLSFSLSVFLSFCLSVFLSFCLSVFLSFCLSVWMGMHILSLPVWYFVFKARAQWSFLCCKALYWVEEQSFYLKKLWTWVWRLCWLINRLQVSCPKGHFGIQNGEDWDQTTDLLVRGRPL